LSGVGERVAGYLIAIDRWPAETVELAMNVRQADALIWRRQIIVR
jgi:hypothetical protein